MKGLVKATVLASLAAVAAAPAALAGKADDTLNIVWEREIENVDNYFNTAREGIIVSRLTWDSLIYRDPQTLEYKPLIASSWRWVDPVTLEFEIKQGLKFHNGEALDARDVAYTYNWVSNPDNGVKTQQNVSWIKSAEAIGTDKVIVNLKAPFPAALEFVSGPLSIYPEDYYKEVGPDGMGLASVGSGPYKITTVEPGRKIVWEKFDGYMADSPKGQPSIGKIVQRTVPERNTQIAELLAGRADWMWRVPADQADRLNASGRVQVVNEQTFRIGYVTMDAAGVTGDTPLKDPASGKPSRTPSTGARSSRRWFAASRRSSTRPASRSSSAAPTTSPSTCMIRPRPRPSWPRRAIRTASPSTSTLTVSVITRKR